MVKRPPVGLGVPWASYEALQQRYDALVKEVLAMKREGFDAPTPSVEPAQQAELPAAIQRAISSIAEPNSQTARQLRTQAWEMLRLGDLGETEIVERIALGEEATL